MLEQMNLLTLLLVVAVDVDALASNAGAEKVERVLPGEKLIVHILDYHIVAKDQFGKNVGIDGDPPELLSGGHGRGGELRRP